MRARDCIGLAFGLVLITAVSSAAAGRDLRLVDAVKAADKPAIAITEVAASART